MLFRIKRRGGEMQDVPAAVSSEGVITLRKEEVPADAESVSFHDDFFTAREGDSGFFLIPSHYYCHDTMLTEFRKREDTEAAYRYNDMPQKKPGRFLPSSPVWIWITNWWSA